MPYECLSKQQNRYDFWLPLQLITQYDMWNNTKDAVAPLSFSVKESRVHKRSKKNRKKRETRVNFDFKMPNDEKTLIQYRSNVNNQKCDQCYSILFTIQSMQNKIIPNRFWFKWKKLHSIKGLLIVCSFIVQQIVMDEEISRVCSSSLHHLHHKRFSVSFVLCYY